MRDYERHLHCPIQARCRTNLDGFEMEKWPEKFQVLPPMGTLIKGASGKVLKVVGITFEPDGGISLELHKTTCKVE